MVAPGRRGRGIAIVQQARRPQRASSRLWVRSFGQRAPPWTLVRNRRESQRQL